MPNRSPWKQDETEKARKSQRGNDMGIAPPGKKKDGGHRRHTERMGPRTLRLRPHIGSDENPKNCEKRPPLQRKRKKEKWIPDRIPSNPPDKRVGGGWDEVPSRAVARPRNLGGKHSHKKKTQRGVKRAKKRLAGGGGQWESREGEYTRTKNSSKR